MVTLFAKSYHRTLNLLQRVTLWMASHLEQVLQHLSNSR